MLKNDLYSAIKSEDSEALCEANKPPQYVSLVGVPWEVAVTIRND